MFKDSLEALSTVNGEIDYGMRDSILRAETGRILLPAVRRGMDWLIWLGLAWFLVWIPLAGPISSFRYGLMFYWALAPFAASLALHATGRLAWRAA